MHIAPPSYSARPGARSVKLALVVLLAGTLAACGAVDRTGRAFWQPYRPNVQQGNWVTQQQIALLREGMTREQVRFALGTPTLTPIFHADRWEYPYYMKPGYGEIEERRFTVFFENNLLVRWEGDEQPRVQPFQDPAAAPATPDPIRIAPLPAVQGVPGSSDTIDAPSAGGANQAEEAAADRAAVEAEQAERARGGNRTIQLQNRPTRGGQGVDPNTGSVPLR